ncbi:MAG: hypothetical protein QW303_07905, partial [Nitrososphaerota archaeon]
MNKKSIYDFFGLENIRFLPEEIKDKIAKKIRKEIWYLSEKCIYSKNINNIKIPKKSKLLVY